VKSVDKKSFEVLCGKTMIIGIGTDITEIKRIENMLQKHGVRFEEKVFTGREREYCDTKPSRARHYAARFAAKEAVYKALGGDTVEHSIGWKDMEIINNESGKPEVILHRAAAALAETLGATSIHLSLSHADSHAIAYCIIEKV